MAELNNHDIYFTLDKQVEQKFILSQNQQALIYARDQAIADYTRAMVMIPAALVQLKWQNRREIYPLRVKEEVYGAVLVELMNRYPELKSQIMVQLESNYQQIKAEEALTLMLNRKLADGTCKTATVKPPKPPEAQVMRTAAAPQAEADAAQPVAPVSQPAAAPQNAPVAPQPVTPAPPSAVGPAPLYSPLPGASTPRR